MNPQAPILSHLDIYYLIFFLTLIVINILMHLAYDGLTRSLNHLGHCQYFEDACRQGYDKPIESSLAQVNILT